MAPNGDSAFLVLDGEWLSPDLGQITLKPGEEGTASPNQAPVRSAVVQTKRLVQWWLYYPGILPAEELAFAEEEKNLLAGSLEAYRTGDILNALFLCSKDVAGGSDSRKVYLAALLLSVGQASQANALLKDVTGLQPQIAALSELISVVESNGSANQGAASKPGEPQPASMLLAESYRLQARFNLAAALASARRAAQTAPAFGFAWARVAELEFSFGRVGAAKEALDQAVRLSPRNAEALALQGFMLAAENQITGAMDSFNQAISVDSALGNAWLGRGLCKFRQHDIQGELSDLETAAALEPSRSLLRSYLGKGFGMARQPEQARKELSLAAGLDGADPTPWLYSAMVNYQEHRKNQAVEDLEKSLSLNDNRRVYRSRLLLDQDRSVRSASLANIYQGAGLTDASLREATRAVAYDYANFSAHRFLADSFNALRDPTRFNLRHESAWFNETLLADLLAPAGMGTFSQQISQQEYFSLFETNPLGLNSVTEARSDKQVTQIASQYGTVGGASYSLDLEYRYNSGVRPNNDLSRVEWYSKIKQRLSPQDALYFLAKYQDYESGDNFQYYNPQASYRPNFRYEEMESPYLAAGYHRNGSPACIPFSWADISPLTKPLRIKALWMCFSQQPGECDQCPNPVL